MIISAIGYPGAGKTSLCQILDATGEFGTFAAEVGKLTQQEVAALRALDRQGHQSRRDYDSYQELYLQIACRKADLLAEMLSASSTVLLDRPVDDVLCITHILEQRGKLRRFPALKAIYFDSLQRARSDVGIYLDVDIHTAKTRLVARGEPYNSRDDYFDLCAGAYREWYMRNQPRLIVEDASAATPEDLANSVADRLRHLLLGR